MVSGGDEGSLGGQHIKPLTRAMVRRMEEKKEASKD